MRLGFCGLGLMGSAMVQRLLACGHRVQVWNRSPDKARALIEQGAICCDTPAQAAQGVDGVLMCLMNAESVASVVFGPQGIAQAPDLKWLVDHASIAPHTTRDMAARLRDICPADWLDAPVSGGVAGVQAGSLAVMVGGAPTHLEAVRQAVSAYAGRVTHMGESGAGQATKLCNQIIVASTVAVHPGSAERSRTLPARSGQLEGVSTSPSKPNRSRAISISRCGPSAKLPANSCICSAMPMR